MTWKPTLPGLFDAPTTATDPGLNAYRSAFTTYSRGLSILIWVLLHGKSMCILDDARTPPDRISIDSRRGAAHHFGKVVRPYTIYGITSGPMRAGESSVHPGEAKLEQAMAKVTDEICQRFGNDRTRMMDIALEVQARFGCVSHEAMEQIARAVNTHRVEVESLVTFYSFLSVKPQGQVVIRLCSDIVDWMKGYEDVADAMSKELGV